MLYLALTSRGHSVTAVAGGAEALDALQNTKFDLVITDVLMPAIDGIEVIAQVRRMHPQTGIIAMTSGGYRGSRDHYLRCAKDCGAHETLGKPFSMSELSSAINRVMSRTR